MSDEHPPAQPVRDLAVGLVAAFTALWSLAFASVTVVEVSTLIAVVAALIWIATVDVHRLRSSDGTTPSPMLFGLASLGLALLIASLVFIHSLTSVITAGLGGSAIVIGLVRAMTAPSRR